MPKNILPKRKVLLVALDEVIAEDAYPLLDSFTFDDEPVLFLRAVDAVAAQDILGDYPDIAVLLLDVAGAKAEAGLKLIRYLRETLGNPHIRLLLRGDAGGPLEDPELLRELDISDYRERVHATVPSLLTATTLALHGYERLVSEDDSRQALQTILDVTKKLYGVRSVEEFCLIILTQLQVICTRANDCFFCLPDEKSGELVIAAGMGCYRKATSRRLSDTVADNIFKAVEQVAVHCENSFTEDMSILSITRDGVFKGAVLMHHSPALTLLERRQIDLICANITLGLENADMFEEIKRLAFNDSLTGLDNRAKFRSDVQMHINNVAAPEGSHFVVVQFVLDHLPELNIALGYEAGDGLLRFVSDQLTQLFPDAISLARTSGNGFGLCLPYGPNRELRQIPKTIHQLFEHGPSDRENLPHITPRIGLAIYPEDAETATGLWRNTNIALATVKSRSGAYFCFYNSMIADDINARVEMNNALRQGIGREDLSLEYQPQVDLKSGCIVAVEALIRWQREDGSFIAPDEFIPVAEASGLILPVSEWVLREACRQRRAWLDAGGEGFHVAVNLSLSVFQNDDLIELVSGILEETGCPPELLEIEVTESVIMEDPDQTLKNFLKLGELGVGFSIDDFGTGYSSLSYLRQMPVSGLKIDKSFIDGMTSEADDAAIARTVITLGRNLGLKVLAEGVETAEQVAFLRAAGCHLAQGYIFSRPVAPEAVLPMLAAGPLIRGEDQSLPS